MYRVLLCVLTWPAFCGDISQTGRRKTEEILRRHPLPLIGKSPLSFFKTLFSFSSSVLSFSTFQSLPCLAGHFFAVPPCFFSRYFPLPLALLGCRGCWICQYAVCQCGNGRVHWGPLLHARIRQVGKKHLNIHFFWLHRQSRQGEKRVWLTQTWSSNCTLHILPQIHNLHCIT